MSARREHRLRQIEKKLEVLGQEAHTAKTLGLVINDNMESIRKRVDSLEIRQNFIEGQMEMKAIDADWKPAQARPQKGLLQRIVDFFGGR